MKRAGLAASPPEARGVEGFLTEHASTPGIVCSFLMTSECSSIGKFHSLVPGSYALSLNDFMASTTCNARP